MASYVVAASVFVLATSYLIQFVVEPPGSSVANLEHIELKTTGQHALEVLLGTPGVPATWSANSSEIDGVDRLGLIDPGTSGRVNATKFDALARGSYATASNANGAIDYAEAKVALALDGHDFHIRAYPGSRAAADASYGVTGMTDFRIAYVGHLTDATTYSVNAQFEADALDNLAVSFTNQTRASNDAGDVYQDDSSSLRQHLLPSLGLTIPQDVIGAGSGTKYDFYRRAASTYENFLTTNVTTTETSAMALSTSAGVLGYTKNRELRAIVGTANLSGTAGGGELATIHWYEWVDTDRGNGTRDCNDYGYVEVSGDGGATWTKLTDTVTERSQDCGTLYAHAAGLAHESAVIDGTTCGSCAGNSAVLVAFHWVADNDNDIGYGWVVDNVQVKVADSIVARKTFESPEYDLLVIGSDALRSAFTPDDIKDAIRDYVDDHGGRIIVLGGETNTNTNWLERLFDAGVGGAGGGVASPDPTHPMLTLPNKLNSGSYAQGTAWDVSAGDASGLFHTVTGTAEDHPYLAVSRQGAWGSGSASDGAVILTSYKPGGWEKAEARKFFANSLVFGKYHHVYLEVGPPVPTDIPVGTATRSATMNTTRTGTPIYSEITFVMYVWPGTSTAATISGASVEPTPVRSVTAEASTTRVWVNWTEPLSVGTGAALTYEVWRGNGPNSMTTLVANRTYTSELSFYDWNVTDGTTWWYNVTMWSTTGRGTPSAGASATPLVYPSAPLSIDAVGGIGTNNVTWAIPTTTGPGIIYGYTVWVNDTGTSSTYHILAEVGNVTYYNHALSDTEPRLYKVSAINGRGSGPNSSVSPPASATIATPVAGPALAVTHLGAGPGNLSLTWTPPADLLGQSLTGYKVWRSAAASDADYSLLATLTDAANVSFADAGLGAGVSRYYKVQAVTSAMDGSNSTAASDATYSLAAAPGSLNVTNATVHQLTLGWTTPTGNGLSLLGYKILRSTDGSSYSTLATLGGELGPLNVSYADANVADNTTYWYKVQAFTSAGDGTLTSAQSMTSKGVPWKVLGLVQTARLAGSVSFEWNAPASDGGSAVTGYEIYAGATEGAETHLIATVATTHTHLTTDYLWYKVRANNSVGSGPFSSSVHMIDLPAAPTLTATNGTPSQLSLSWSAPSAAGGTIDGYQVERSPDGSTWTVFSTLTSLANRTWADATAGTNTSWQYRVAAHTEAGYGEYSPTATKSTTGLPWPPTITLLNTTAHVINLTWTGYNLGGGTYASFTIDRSTDGSTWAALVTSTNSNQSWNDATVSDNTTYYYRVRVTNDVGTGGWSASTSTTAAGVPWAVGVLADGSGVPGTNIINWAAVNSGGSAITKYEVWSGATAGTQTFLADVLVGTSHTHAAGLGVTTYYKVRAVNAVGEGAFSAVYAMTS